jgi:hypothetical protein
LSITKIKIMKATQFLPLALLSITSLSVFAQTSTSNAAPLLGDWSEKTDSALEIKLISPTHVFFFAKNPTNDSFSVAGAGTYTLIGNQFTENLQYATFDLKDIKATYNYNVQGNKFTQEGTLVLSDTVRIPINHTFTRIEGAMQNSGKQIGTWNQLSSSYLNDDGTKASHTNTTHVRYQIITPTHWMRISLANGKFENAFGGTYTITGDKMMAKIDFASMPIVGSTAELTQKFEGNKLTWTGIVKDAQGKKVNEITDVFERVQ